MSKDKDTMVIMLDTYNHITIVPLWMFSAISKNDCNPFLKSYFFCKRSGTTWGMVIEIAKAFGWPVNVNTQMIQSIL